MNIANVHRVEFITLMMRMLLRMLRRMLMAVVVLLLLAVLLLLLLLMVMVRGLLSAAIRPAPLAADTGAAQTEIPVHHGHIVRAHGL